MMDLHKIRTTLGITPEELERAQKGLLAMGTLEPKNYTWEAKIESLVALAKAAGRYINAENGTDYCVEAYERLKEAYEEFCQWRHDEPYVVDEIRAMLAAQSEETPPRVHGHALCGYCGKMYQGPLSIGWYGYRENGQEWVFCSDHHKKLWKFDQAPKKQQQTPLPATLAAIEAIPEGYVSSTAICRTCGGDTLHHRPSVLDPNGVGHPGHKIAIEKR